MLDSLLVGSSTRTASTAARNSSSSPEPSATNTYTWSQALVACFAAARSSWCSSASSSLPVWERQAARVLVVSHCSRDSEADRLDRSTCSAVQMAAQHQCHTVLSLSSTSLAMDWEAVVSAQVESETRPVANCVIDSRVS